MGTLDNIRNHKETHQRGGDFDKFNLQSGNKMEQIFHVKLLPRLAPPTAECNAAFHEFFNHYKCGPDSDQTMTCLNHNLDDIKKNAKRCPACSITKKIIRNSSVEQDVDIAKGKSARRRVNWPVFDLDKRKQVEIMEIGGRSFDDDLLTKFRDAAGKELDLADLTIPCCVEITRRNSGEYSRYQFAVLIDQQWAITTDDIPKIQQTYVAPESVVKRISLAEFNENFHGTFDVSEGNEPPVAVVPGQPATPEQLAALNAAQSAASSGRKRPGAPASAPAAPAAGATASLADLQKLAMANQGSPQAAPAPVVVTPPPPPPPAPAPVPQWNGTPEWLEKHCSVCGEQQYTSAQGPTCAGGHINAVAQEDMPAPVPAQPAAPPAPAMPAPPAAPAMPAPPAAPVASVATGSNADLMAQLQNLQNQ